jgi:hypothetical protein
MRSISLSTADATTVVCVLLRSRIEQNGEERSRMEQNGAEWRRMEQNGAE